MTIDDAIDFLNCTELKGQDTHFIGRKIDIKCVIKTNTIINENSNYIVSEESNSDNTNIDENLEEKLKKLKTLFEKKLITRDEYDEKRNELLDNF